MKIKMKIKIKAKIFYMKPKIDQTDIAAKSKVIGQLKPFKALSKVALYS